MQLAKSVLSNKIHPLIRLNGICPYYTMFPISFPATVLLRAQKTDWILDPFCGRGTTNYAARLLGLNSVGVDINRVAVAIASSKVVPFDRQKIIKLAQSILNNQKTPKFVPSTLFWRMLYKRSTLVDICRLREHFLESCASSEEIMLRAIVLGILHGPQRKDKPTYLSNQMPRTYATKPRAAISYWKKHGLKSESISVLDAVIRRVNYVGEETPNKGQGKIYVGDSRNFCWGNLKRKFDWIITSPPYYGMRTYKADQWIRSWFLGGSEVVEYQEANQVKHTSPSLFCDELAKVWTGVSVVAKKGAYLVVRFGALPSSKANPLELIKESVNRSDAHWKILTVRNAGSAGSGKRQAVQFHKDVSGSLGEVDLYARLEK